MVSSCFRPHIRIWGFITVAGSVAGVLSVLGFLGDFHWAFDLCAHFRVQYFLGLTVVALLLLIRKKRVWSVVFGFLAAANLSLIVPLYLQGDSAPVAGGRPIRLILMNVNTEYGDPVRVAAFLRQYSPDILVLEEVNSTWLAELRLVLIQYPYSEQEPRDDNFGIAVFSKFRIASSKVAHIGSAEVPSIVAEIETPEGRLTVLATHPLPPAGGEYSRWRNEQLAALSPWVKAATSPVILIGDLNLSPWSPHFVRLLRETGLRSSAQGRGICASWPSNMPWFCIPIDHCLYSQGVGVVGYRIGPYVGSDHYPVIVDAVIMTRRTE